MKKSRFTETQIASILSESQDLQEATGINVFFCDRKSPWQRSTNETRTDYCDSVSHMAPTCPQFAADLDRIKARINRRPRKTVGQETPQKVLQVRYALTC